MGSDWVWELRVPMAAEPALREFYALAAERNLDPHRPDGRINLFSNPDAELRTVEGTAVALAALATGKEHGQLWTNGDVDVFLSWENGTLQWALDSVFCYRRPVPEADTFRELHIVRDEWSSDQVWHLCGPDAEHPAGVWPVELGWWTYLSPRRPPATPPLPEVAAQARQLSNGALLISLLDDPAAVDPLHYEDIHTRWLQAL